MKTCPRCKDLKSLDAFGLNRTRRDGRQGFCRQCMSEAVAAAQAKRRDYYLAQRLDWAVKNPVRVELARKRHRASGKAAAAERARYDPACRTARAKREAAELGRRYVAGRITRGEFDWRLVPPEIVEAKRAHLLLQREIRSQK